MPSVPVPPDGPSSATVKRRRPPSAATGSGGAAYHLDGAGDEQIDEASVVGHRNVGVATRCLGVEGEAVNGKAIVVGSHRHARLEGGNIVACDGIYRGCRIETSRNIGLGRYANLRAETIEHPGR